jgi:hypothetical protein
MTATTLPAFAAVVGLHLLIAMRWDAAPEVAPWQTEGAISVVHLTPTGGCDNDCDAASPLWCSTRTKAACVPLFIAPIDAPLRRSAQTGLGVDNKDAASVPMPGTFYAAELWPEAPLGMTDGLRPEPAGVSRRLHRRHKRRRQVRRVPDSSDVQPPLSATMSLWAGLVIVHPPAACAMWACVSAIVGLHWLATDRHFGRPVCAALSLNYWCAAAWIAWAVSPELGVALATMAMGLRGSMLLFPNSDLERLLHGLSDHITAEDAANIVGRVIGHTSKKRRVESTTASDYIDHLIDQGYGVPCSDELKSLYDVLMQLGVNKPFLAQFVPFLPNGGAGSADVAALSIGK